MAGKHFQTEVANIKLTPPSIVSGFFLFVCLFACFCLLLLRFCYRRTCLTSSPILFECSPQVQGVNSGEGRRMPPLPAHRLVQSLQQPALSSEREGASAEAAS